MIVVDSNVIAYCFIRSERTDLAQRVRLRDSAWHVPILWRSELRSALAGYMWRDGLQAGRAAAIMAAAEDALAGCEHLVASDAVLELAAESRLSAYDCEFVALAQALAVPLVTEDRAILKAFPQLALTMESFLDSLAAAHQSRARYHPIGSGKASRASRPTPLSSSPRRESKTRSTRRTAHR